MKTRIDSRTWAEIDLSALLHNLKYAKRCVNDRPIMCVVKADAYGHGAVPCGLFLEKNGADAFAVACLEEAIAMREGGIKLPILILGYTAAEYADILAEYNLTQTLLDLSHAREMSAAAKGYNVRVQAHIKLDTGMGRAGILAQGKQYMHDAIIDACRECELPNLDIKGMYTHMSVADTPSQIDYTNWQIENYNTVCEGLIANGHDIECCHMSNSAGIINHPQAHFDIVREGIMLYGMYPDSRPVKNGPLRPVMTLKSRVSQIRHFPKGTTISYGRTYRAEEDITAAVITAGYADGYPRRMSNNARFAIRGKSYEQIGRVCMDMMMADVTGSDVSRGDEVILFGQNGMSVEEVAQIVGTINYELTCRVTNRARRMYLNDR
ncbi:MAG: alanine racemase [Clostridia bacterium]|nr:alanine racemase [Clostridia bacterium]